jgi:uncharacterized protein YfcZ (UPF0381/DUF406 family)
MPINSRKRILRNSFWFAGLFVALFIFRFLYGYYGAAANSNDYVNGSNFFDNLSNLRKNYASEKISNNARNAEVQGSGDLSNTQKYEKTATVSSKTAHFEEDESLIRKTTESFDGSIQYEQSQGRKGGRELYLSIGVKPSSFDSFYRMVQGVGELRSTMITKVDKTNEYRQLNAKKASLEKTLNSLNDLKSKGGAISDFVSLHDKILEVETQLQQLGVDLGNYNTENEFCTLRFSLLEGTAIRKASFYQRIKITLEWTIKYYAVSILALAGVLVCSFLLLLITDRLKILSAVVSRLKE